MAPEVITDGKMYDTKVDIWSLGVTIYEIATGNPPFYGMEPLRACALIPRQQPPRLPEGGVYSAPMRDFLAACLQIDPAQRLSADELPKTKWIRSVAKLPMAPLRELIARYLGWVQAGGQRTSLVAVAGVESLAREDTFDIDDDPNDNNRWDFDVDDSMDEIQRPLRAIIDEPVVPIGDEPTRSAQTIRASQIGPSRPPANPSLARSHPLMRLFEDVEPPPAPSASSWSMRTPSSTRTGSSSGGGSAGMSFGASPYETMRPTISIPTLEEMDEMAESSFSSQPNDFVADLASPQTFRPPSTSFHGRGGSSGGGGGASSFWQHSNRPFGHKSRASITSQASISFDFRGGAGASFGDVSLSSSPPRSASPSSAGPRSRSQTPDVYHQQFHHSRTSTPTDPRFADMPPLPPMPSSLASTSASIPASAPHVTSSPSMPAIPTVGASSERPAQLARNRANTAPSVDYPPLGPGIPSRHRQEASLDATRSSPSAGLSLPTSRRPSATSANMPAGPANGRTSKAHVVPLGGGMVELMSTGDVNRPFRRRAGSDANRAASGTRPRAGTDAGRGAGYGGRHGTAGKLSINTSASYSQFQGASTAQLPSPADSAATPVSRHHPAVTGSYGARPPMPFSNGSTPDVNTPLPGQHQQQQQQNGSSRRHRRQTSSVGQLSSSSSINGYPFPNMGEISPTTPSAPTFGGIETTDEDNRFFVEEGQPRRRQQQQSGQGHQRDDTQHNQAAWPLGPPVRPLEYSNLFSRHAVEAELEHTLADLGKWLDVVDDGLARILSGTSI